MCTAILPVNTKYIEIKPDPVHNKKSGFKKG